MRLTIPTIAIAAATFAATLAFAPAIADAARNLNFAQFLTPTAPEKAPVAVARQKPNCSNAFGALVDALGDKDCI
jgi:hypothetical protein